MVFFLHNCVFLSARLWKGHPSEAKDNSSRRFTNGIRRHNMKILVLDTTVPSPFDALQPNLATDHIGKWKILRSLLYFGNLLFKYDDFRKIFLQIWQLWRISSTRILCMSCALDFIFFGHQVAKTHPKKKNAEKLSTHEFFVQSRLCHNWDWNSCA